jgi:hypothetical protein
MTRTNITPDLSETIESPDGEIHKVVDGLWTQPQLIEFTLIYGDPHVENSFGAA